ncbi:MAG TPA: endonuclease III [Candidatus Babeliaceae bacterium]|nr:endonuclease III [Candidatus Babeliaceae bacterium]
MVLSFRDKRKVIEKLLNQLKEATVGLTKPMVPRLIEKYGRDPFLILIACLLSLRARDTVTYGIAKKLFEYAHTPQELLSIPIAKLEEIIYGTGFYRRKAKVLHDVSQEIISKYHGKVPSTETELLSLPGVGRKTANLVLAEAFGVPALFVDTHVHYLANVTGLVHTKNPLQTEQALKKIVPKDQWHVLSNLFVTWGQNFCTPSKSKPWCKQLTDNPQLGIKKPNL